MITTKERAFLRGLAQKLEPVVQIGKGGITESVLNSIDLVLDKRELIKIRLLPNSLLDTKTAMEQICDGLGADPVQQIGSVVVVYKKSKRKDAKHIL
ncbi:MAG TPA: ribosome assembly RNA-binding protein YhbY [Clostridiales bacterium]|nr:ribosome assembly RNA-binding protein YhbY [Clostridiales bacterium]